MRLIAALVIGVVVVVAGRVAAVHFDEFGVVPKDKATAKCENKVATKVGKLVGAIIACHVKAAKVAFKTKITTDQNTDQPCEDAAKAAFERTSTTGCECVQLTTIANNTEALLDVSNQSIFCASPSGAFVDGTLG